MNKDKNDLINHAYYDMEKIRTEFLKYAPSYAIEEAKQAISKIIDLQRQGVIRNGLYYIVLVDLVGSTKFTAKYGNKKAVKRIEYFVTSSFNALNEITLSNTAIFLKEIGDAVLYIFQHFPDILRWHDSFLKWLSIYDSFHNKKVVIKIRTCINTGEVYLDGVNPISLAVSQVFKMEKSVKSSDIILTDTAYHAAWPTIARAYHAFEDYGEILFDGFKHSSKLHKLLVFKDDSTKKIADEKLD